MADLTDEGRAFEDDSFGRTALHYAAADGDTAEVSRLLADSEDPNAADSAGFTPLHFAAQEQRTELIGMLVAAGADPAARDRWGNTPLWRAVFTARGRTATVDALLAAGSDLDAVNDSGVSPRILRQTLSRTLNRGAGVPTQTGRRERSWRLRIG